MSDKKKIEEKVNNLIETHDIDIENGVDIISLAHKMGFVVGNAGLSDTEDGFVLVDDKAEKILGVPTTKLIGVNANIEYEHKRFVIAHELAHFVLNKGDNPIYAHRENKKGKNEEENDADYFAACLLMPEKSFKKRYEELKADGLPSGKILEKLQEIFMVSYKGILRRVDELNLLTDQG